MAAWLQKRLKDAEALLEQADRTAQRVVVKDKDKVKVVTSQDIVPPASGLSASAPNKARKELFKPKSTAGGPQVTSQDARQEAAIRPSITPSAPSTKPTAPSAPGPSTSQMSALNPPGDAQLPLINTTSKRRLLPAGVSQAAAPALQQIPFMTPATGPPIRHQRPVSSPVSSPQQADSPAQNEARPSEAIAANSPAHQQAGSSESPAAEHSTIGSEGLESEESIPGNGHEPGTAGNGETKPNSSSQTATERASTQQSAEAAVATDATPQVEPVRDAATQDPSSTAIDVGTDAAPGVARSGNEGRLAATQGQSPSAVARTVSSPAKQATHLSTDRPAAGVSTDTDSPSTVAQSQPQSQPPSQIEAEAQAPSVSASAAEVPSDSTSSGIAVQSQAPAGAAANLPSALTSSSTVVQSQAPAASVFTAQLRNASTSSSSATQSQALLAASLPGPSTSSSIAMQSQASLPADPSARAAAVAEAIKRAAQASGQDQPHVVGGGEGVPQPQAGGAGREALLSRLVEQLKGRLQSLREENQQLEDMLHQSDARASGSVREVERLEDALSHAQAARSSAEAGLAHTTALQAGQVQEAQQGLQAATRELQDCQARLADLEATNAMLIQEHQVSEGRIIAALRDEVTAAEVRLEEERAAHTNTQRTAAAREQALQSSMADGGSALAGMQRLVEERTQQASAAQQQAMQLQRDHSLLAARLATAQDQADARQDGMSVEAQVELQAEADRWQQQTASSNEALREAQAACQQAESEVERLQGTVRDLQRDAQSRGGYEDLQSRFKEVTELLYTKQTQLERMAGEKAAQQLAHERQIAQAKDDAERVKRRVKTERASASFGSSTEDVVVPMDSLGEAFDRLANDNRVGSYVKAGARALDTTAAAAVRLIKQYPLGRLCIFLYIIGIHLFVYVLINRLQGQALGHLHNSSTTMEDLNSRI